MTTRAAVRNVAAQPPVTQEKVMSKDPPSSITSDGASAPGAYFTDGVRLVRLLAEGHATHGFVWLENCATLEVLLLRADELRDGALRPLCARAVAREPPPGAWPRGADGI